MRKYALIIFVGLSVLSLLSVTPHQAAPSIPVWVFFRDKNLSASELSVGLARTDASLLPRTRARRAKSRRGIDVLVDQADLPLSRLYLNQAAATGAVLRHRAKWLNAASYNATPQQKKALQDLVCVDRVEPVRRGHHLAIPTPVPIEPGLQSIPPDKLTGDPYDYGPNRAAMVQANVLPMHEMGYTGKGVLVGLLDTGFSYVHEALEHIPVVAEWDFINNDGYVDDQGDDEILSNEHGTKVLSVMAGFFPGEIVAPAPAVSIVLGKTEHIEEEVPLEEDHWVAGLAWAESLGVDMVSSSLGYIDWYTFDDLDGDTAVSTVAADLAAARGVVVLTSAGNMGSTGTILAPSDGDSVLAIGAVDAAGYKTSFSSLGPTADGRIKPDVMALGLGNRCVNHLRNDEYTYFSGTSASCPLVAGVVALILERNPGLTVVQVIEALRETANNADAPNNRVGWGVVDAYAAATWFGPSLFHSPLAELNSDPGPHTISAEIWDRQGLDPGAVNVVWRLNSGPWQEIAMSPTGVDSTWTAQLPMLTLFDQVEYYLQATGVSGFTQTDPPFAPGDVYCMRVTEWTTTDFFLEVNTPLPDSSMRGVAAVFSVPYLHAGLVYDVRVDIAVTHPVQSQLRVTLQSPTGVEVVLHNETGTEPNLKGTWPESLTVSGPGSLADFQGQYNVGDWILTVADGTTLETGVFDSAALHFAVYDFVSPVPQTNTSPLASSLAAAPNPFNPSTTISFNLDNPAHPRLDIFDVQGRHVRTLLDESRFPGHQTVVWNGRDDRGRELSSGTYMYRLKVGPDVVGAKVMLVR